MLYLFLDYMCQVKRSVTHLGDPQLFFSHSPLNNSPASLKTRDQSLSTHTLSSALVFRYSKYIHFKVLLGDPMLCRLHLKGHRDCGFLELERNGFAMLPSLSLVKISVWLQGDGSDRLYPIQPNNLIITHS